MPRHGFAFRHGAEYTLGHCHPIDVSSSLFEVLSGLPDATVDTLDQSQFDALHAEATWRSGDSQNEDAHQPASTSVQSNAVRHPLASLRNAASFDAEPPLNMPAVRLRQTLSADASLLHVCEKGLPVSRSQLLQHGLVEFRLGQQFLQP